MAQKILQSSNQAWRAISNTPAVAAPLAAVGGLWVASKLWNVAAFTYFHFLRPSNLDHYKVHSGGSSADPWALVTGASDGIGKGFAHELCKRGFNVVLHGRNEQKLNGVKDDLLKQWPHRQVRVITMDAGAPFDIVKLEAALGPIKDLNIKLLFNNVGGKNRPWFVPLEKQSTDDVQEWLDLNTRIHVEVTRVLLPQLIRNSPAAVVNTGSFAAEIPLPWMNVYGGGKAFLKRWTSGMNLEMRVLGHDVQFYNIITGEVCSNAYPKRVGFAVPTSRNFAKHALDKIGGGRRDTPGYWVHAMQLAMFGALPTWMVENKGIQAMTENMKEEQEESKAK